MEHAYIKLAGVDGKPPFNDVYTYLKKFVKPFAGKDDTPKIWESDKLEWHNYNGNITESYK